MDPLKDEKIDFGDEEYGGSQKMPYHHAGAIPALAEEEMMGEDDEYDDLYNDVNVGENFMQMQRAEAQMPSSGVGNGGYQASNANPSGPRLDTMASQEPNKARVANEGNYPPTPVQYPEQQNPNLPANHGHVQVVDAQRGKLPEMAHNPQTGNFGTNQNNPAPLLNQNAGSSQITPHIPPSMMNSNSNVNINRSMNDDYQVRPGVENGNTMLFVGELHWWTTDAELESVLIQYGKVKEIKFYDERASGKSKGYCQVEFYDPASAAACKEGMDGHIFNGRACVVAFATAQSIRQMGASYNRNQSQAQPQNLGRNNMNDGAGRGGMGNNGTNFNSGDGGRNFGRGGWGGRGGNQGPNRGPGAGPMRGRGGMANNRNMMGNTPNTGGGGAFGQGMAGPGFGGPPGMMHPQGMMGTGFDLAYMGRGAGYGGFSGPSFPGMMPPYPPVNSMGLPGVAPHVNPAFFGRGMAPNGMGMMGAGGMEGPHSGMWNDPNMGGWGGEEHGRGTRESSYGGDDNASEYGGSHDKGARSSAVSRDKDRNSEREWSGHPEKKRREERGHDGDRYDREQRYNREDKDRHRDYRHKDRDTGYDDDWDRGQSSRSRSRSRAVPEEHHGSRSRDADYGKRRRMPPE